MLGVVGPYFDDSRPYDFTSTFSRINSKLGEISAKDEAKWVHENIAMARQMNELRATCRKFQRNEMLVATEFIPLKMINDTKQDFRRNEI